jgi:rubrerythrin
MSLGINLTANEVLEIAVQIERNGITFYEQAARLAKRPEDRQLLNSLAQMEVEHENIFLEMKAALTAAERAGSEIDADAEAAQFLQAIAGGHVFDLQSVGEILTGQETPQEILATAIGLEKESVVYYSALREIIESPPSRAKVEQIIREELRHVAQLSRQKASLPPQEPK